MPAPIQSALKTSGVSHSTNAVGLRPMDWIASNLRRFSATFEASTCRWLRRRKPRISVALCVWRNSPGTRCAAGNERAWQDFISAIEQTARQWHCTSPVTHAMRTNWPIPCFAELYGVNTRDGVRHSKLAFYTARGSLEAGLRTVMGRSSSIVIASRSASSVSTNRKMRVRSLSLRIRHR